MTRDPAVGDIITPSGVSPHGLVGLYTSTLFAHEGCIDNGTLGTVISVMPAAIILSPTQLRHYPDALIMIIMSSVELLHAVWFYPRKASQFIAIVAAAS